MVLLIPLPLTLKYNLFLFNKDKKRAFVDSKELLHCPVEGQLLHHLQANLARCVSPLFWEAHGPQVCASSSRSSWWNNRHLYFYVSHRWLCSTTWEVLLKTNESHNACSVPKYYGNITIWHRLTDCKIQRGQMGGTVGNRIQWEL